MFPQDAVQDVLSDVEQGMSSSWMTSHTEDTGGGSPYYVVSDELPDESSA